jgi:polyisoprenoid-binding protein YceI
MTKSKAAMKWTALALVALALPGLAGCTAFRVLTHETTTQADRLQSGAYVIDPDHVSVVFKVDHFGFSRYVGRFDGVKASLDFDPANPAASRLDVAIEAASVDSHNPAVDEQLVGPDLFDADNFPEITFVGTDIKPAGAQTGQVTGDLTLHGVTRPVTLDVVFNGGAANPLTGAETIGFSATTEFRRSDFGLGAWIPAVGNLVRVEIEAEFVRRDAANAGARPTARKLVAAADFAP